MSKSPFIDTSCVVRYLVGEPEDMATRAAEILEGQDELLLSELVLVETAYVLESFYKIARDPLVEALALLVQRRNIRLLGLEKALALQALTKCRGSKRISFTKALKLDDDDTRPLLEAMSSRRLDTCLRGTRGLAQLRDPRAFGVLLQLSRDSDTSARVQAAKALAALGDRRAEDRLRRMLRDKDASVRDASFTALGRLDGAEPLRVAEAGLAVEHEDVRSRALKSRSKRRSRKPGPRRFSSSSSTIPRRSYGPTPTNSRSRKPRTRIPG